MKSYLILAHLLSSLPSNAMDREKLKLALLPSIQESDSPCTPQAAAGHGKRMLKDSPHSPHTYGFNIEKEVIRSMHITNLIRYDKKEKKLLISTKIFIRNKLVAYSQSEIEI